VYLGVNVHAVGMSGALGELAADLDTIQTRLHDLLAALPAASWDLPTPAAGWTVRHQVRHLAYGEELGRLAAVDPAAFATELERLVADLAAVEAATTGDSGDPDAEVLARWWQAARDLRAAVLAGPADERIDWVTGPMSRASFLTARLMEAFAHGHDVAVAAGRELDVDEALHHVAHLGFATRGFAYANRGLPVPDAPVRLELTGPGGERWTWGPPDAGDVVRGPALDWCLLVTQRIHRDDTHLEATGSAASGWLAIAQCFAGPPTDGPPPRHT
jgi:uncharacterized protein (TIGR03084 family)